MAEPWFGLWSPFLALAATLLPLLWAKRWTTRSLQELSLRWTGDRDVALVVYFVLVLPGVVLHELSHWLTARALGARVSGLSLGPVRKRGNRVSLGSVRVGRVDVVRGILIGLAPLLVASAVIWLIGNQVLGVDELLAAAPQGGLDLAVAGARQIMNVPDVWVWLYLIFAVSNAMLPSESDMWAVRPVLAFLLLAAVIVLVLGGVPSVSREVVEVAGTAATFLASAFGLTLAADVVFGAVIGLLLWITRRMQVPQ
ncbi:MAG: hypothetical protein JXA93_23105 [Anaerolineae bacterium]|nr:hypothetical protein [Anaerolineae bacterium]